MDKKKLVFASVASLVLLLAGLYLSGYLALLLLKLDTGLLKWNTYLEYLKALDLPQVQRYAGKIKVAGYLGFGLPLMAWLALLFLVLRPAGVKLFECMGPGMAYGTESGKIT